MASQNRSNKTKRPARHPENITASWVCILLALAVFIVFGRTLRHDFVNYDDNMYVYDNPRISAGLSLGAIGWAFTHVHADNWHPITTISHMLDCQLFGLQPWGHHLVNVLLHATAAILLFLAMRKLTLTLWVSAFVAALFAIHPLRVESVAWVSERKDLLSGIFFALTIWMYATYVRQVEHRSRNYALVIVFFALGLLSKPTLVTLPFVLLLLDYWPLGRWPGAKGAEQEAGKEQSAKRQQNKSASQRFEFSAFAGLVVEKIPLFVLSAASCVATVVAQKAALDTMSHLTFQERFANAVLSYAIYLRQMIFPIGLTPLYPYTVNGPRSLEVIVCLAALWILTIGFFLLRKRFPFLLTGWCWYVGMLVPMSGIVQVGWQTRADRYTYLPQIGIYLALTVGVVTLVSSPLWRRKILPAGACVFILIFAGVSFIQASYWKNSDTLWRHSIDVNPQNYIAHNNLGDSIMANGHVEEAIAHFRKAIAANPDYAEGHYNLGNALASLDRNLEAIPSFQAAIRARPNFYQAHNNLACMLMSAGKTDQAVAEFTEALRLHAEYQEAHLNLGQLLVRIGRTDQGNAHLAQAARLKAVQGETKEASSFAVSPSR